MRFLPLLILLLCCACQNSEPAPETPPVEESTSSPTPDLVQPADPTGIPLQAIEFADSAKLVPELARSPMAVYRISTFAARSGDEALNSVVNTALANVIAGEEAPIRTTDLRKVVVTSVKTRLINYKKQSVDTAEVAKNREAWVLDVDYNTWVLHNANGLLTLATEHSYYTGGPHGNSETVLHNFDVTIGKQLTFEDLFKPGTERALLALLKAQDPKDIDIYYTENIALTDKGILLDYRPYEIDFHVAGDTGVTLGYDEVESLLTETGRAVIKRIGGL